MDTKFYNSHWLIHRLTIMLSYKLFSRKLERRGFCHPLKYISTVLFQDPLLLKFSLESNHLVKEFSVLIELHPDGYYTWFQILNLLKSNILKSIFAKED